MEKIKQRFTALSGKQKQNISFVFFLALYGVLLCILPSTFLGFFFACVSGWQIGQWVGKFLQDKFPD